MNIKWIFSVILIALSIFMFSNRALAIGKFLPTTSLTGIDATNPYFNVAALPTLTRKQVIFADTLFPHNQVFQGTASNLGIGSPTSTTGRIKTNSFFTIPAIYLAVPITRKLVMDVTLTVQPRIRQDYPNWSMLRYNFIKVYERSTDLGIGFGYKLTPKFFAGLAVDTGYVNDYAKYAIRTQALTINDSIQTVQTTSYYVGWHGGILYNPTQRATIGLAYHSGITAREHGTSRFYTGTLSRFLPPGFFPRVVTSTKTRLILPFPSITTLTGRYILTARWGASLGAQFNNWSVFQKDHIYSLAVPTGTTDVISSRNFHNTWTFNAATWYVINPKLIGYVGVTHTGSPANPTGRNVSTTYLPVWGLSLAGSYQATRNFSLNLGYSHIFPTSGQIRAINTGPSAPSVVGTQKEYSEVITMQGVLNFG